MKRRVLLALGLLGLALFSIVSSTGAQSQTVGLLQHDPGTFDGYTLFGPNTYPVTYLIDIDGNVVNSWNTGIGRGGYLQPDGTLYRLSYGPTNSQFSGSGGSVKRFAWDGTLLWQYDYNTPEHLNHHDISVLPNGNVLLIAYEYRSAQEAIDAGRDPNLLRDGELWPMHIVEVQPTGPTTGDIVWEWHTWDHLVQDVDNTKANFGVVADHPELVDVNYFEPTRPATGEADWLHENGIDYNPELDQIVVSVRHFSELWVIDHSTTTAEAASHAGGGSDMGGDLLYRWGNPAAYDAGDVSDQQFFMQHDSQWNDAGLPGAGNLMVFNNGNGRPGPDYSSAMEITPPVDIDGNYALTPGEAYGPAAPVWEYTAPNPTDFNSAIISGVQRLPNGNTLICEGVPGTLFEVKPDGTIVWVYINPVISSGPVTQGTVLPAPGMANPVFQSQRYALDYAGLNGQDLTPGQPIELYPDMDGDGLLDFDETKLYGTDPSLPDTDADGLTDYEEVVTHLTDPLVVDTDGGGAPDNIDALEGDPLDPGDDAAILAADSDGDGCTNGTELGPNEEVGGRRDPLNQWDFFDVDGDGSVGLFSDIFIVAEAYGQSTGGPLYSTEKDRSPPLEGMDVWDMRAPDGTIDLFYDIFGVAAQFGHRCA
jgi:hypothetical protein